MKRIVMTFLGVLLIIFNLAAQNRYETIQIMPGEFTPVDSSSVLPITGFTFANSQTVGFCRMIIFMELGESLNLSVINNDSELHGFK